MNRLPKMQPRAEASRPRRPPDASRQRATYARPWAACSAAHRRPAIPSASSSKLSRGCSPTAARSTSCARTCRSASPTHRPAIFHVHAGDHRDAAGPRDVVASSVLVEHAIVTVPPDAVAAVVLRAARPAAVRAAPGAVDHADADVDGVTIARLAAVRAVAGLRAISVDVMASSLAASAARPAPRGSNHRGGRDLGDLSPATIFLAADLRVRPRRRIGQPGERTDHLSICCLRSSKITARASPGSRMATPAHSGHNGARC